MNLIKFNKFNINDISIKFRNFIDKAPGKTKNKYSD